MVCACEDVGLAWPQIIPIVKAAVDIANAVGLPEARLPLADAVVLVATAPKSNSAHDGTTPPLRIHRPGAPGHPRQLQNKHYDGADAKVPRVSITSTHTITQSLGRPAIPARCYQGLPVLRPRREQERAGLRPILEENKGE